MRGDGCINGTLLWYMCYYCTYQRSLGFLWYIMSMVISACERVMLLVLVVQVVDFGAGGHGGCGIGSARYNLLVLLQEALRPVKLVVLVVAIDFGNAGYSGAGGIGGTTSSCGGSCTSSSAAGASVVPVFDWGVDADGSGAGVADANDRLWSWKVVALTAVLVNSGEEVRFFFVLV